MLYIDYCGKVYKSQTYIPGVFEDNFKDEWMSDTTVQAIIKAIDNSTVIAPHVLENPYFGTHSHLQLSSGCKCTILAYKTDIILDGDRMGDNCYPWICMLSLYKDIKLTLQRVPSITHGIPVTIVNTNKVYTYGKDFVYDSLKELYGD